jgi:hypothetical protein
MVCTVYADVVGVERRGRIGCRSAPRSIAALWHTSAKFPIRPASTQGLEHRYTHVFRVGGDVREWSGGSARHGKVFRDENLKVGEEKWREGGLDARL